ncbi:unnamed protein product [Adineta ricciae]|uniref:Uncharacterized protein n=1 Tax=Adineta ricciae TaxID=249248 RepID=A0A814P7E8_ADIRI|nr:unnamed protein product [Adineta ricciae]
MAETSKAIDQNLPSVFLQIQEQLKHIREDNMDLTEQLTLLYNDLCHIRRILSNTQQSNVNLNLNTTSLIEPSTSSRYHPKQRSDSEPNILSDRQRVVTIIDDLQ